MPTLKEAVPSGADADVVDWPLHELARRTWRTDRRRYWAEPEPPSLRRLWRTALPDLRRPVFLIGSPRSGTTFMGECLSALREVSYHFEPVATKAAARYVYEGSWSFYRAKFFYRQVYAWLMRVHLNGHRRFAEKNPVNCFLISFLQRAFPGAQFLNIVRDGRDAALSHSKKPWLQATAAASGRREAGGYLNGPYPRFWVEPDRREEFRTTSDLHRCIWAWRRYNESILAQRDALPSTHYHVVRYEALVSRGHEEAEMMLDFLEIEDSASRRRFRTAVARATPGSIGRWRAELTQADLAQVDAEAGPLLNVLGYSG